jgi:hypothetical protein
MPSLPLWYITVRVVLEEQSNTLLGPLHNGAVRLSVKRLALPAAAGTRLAHETDKTQSHEKSLFSGVNPAALS